MTRNLAPLIPIVSPPAASPMGMWLRASSAGLAGAILAMQVQGNHVQILIFAAASATALAFVWEWYRRYRVLIDQLHHTIAHWHRSKHMGHDILTGQQSLATLVGQMKQALDQSLETHRLHMHLKMQLSASHHSLNDYQSLADLHGDMKHLFKRIALYSQMLEETLARHASASALRDTFDELSEQSFNLQLFIAAFERLRQPTARGSAERINPTQTLSRVLVPLASALDRRSMQLSSAAWDERARAYARNDELELMVWLILLGTVRYAEDESTLVLSCEPSADGATTFITCLVTELAPAAMSPHERADFMDAHHKYQSAHMFAYTLAASTNITLASRLAQRVHGSLTVHPRTQTSCMIELSLPRGA